MSSAHSFVSTINIYMLGRLVSILKSSLLSEAYSVPVCQSLSLFSLWFC